MKHFVITSCLLLLVSVQTLAQSKFSIAPSYGYNFGNEQYTLRVDNKEIMSYSGNSYGSTFGVVARYAFGAHWDLSVGLLYTGLISNVKYYYAQPYQTLGRKLKTDYAQLPILINYRLSQKRLSPYFSAGVLISNQFLIANQIGLKTSALAGIGIDYQFSPKLSLLVQPTGSYLLTKPENDASNQFTSYLSYLVGLQTQLKWQF